MTQDFTSQPARDRTRPVARFEDLIAWQKARVLRRDIGRTARRAFPKDFELRSQICGAAGSAMANVAEGYRRFNPCDSQNFYNTAKASAGEVQSHLYIALDDGYITQDEFDTLYAQADEVCKIIQGLRADAERKCTAKKGK